MTVTSNYFRNVHGIFFGGVLSYQQFDHVSWIVRSIEWAFSTWTQSEKNIVQGKITNYFTIIQYDHSVLKGTFSQNDILYFNGHGVISQYVFVVRCSIMKREITKCSKLLMKYNTKNLKLWLTEVNLLTIYIDLTFLWKISFLFLDPNLNR